MIKTADGKVLDDASARAQASLEHLEDILKERAKGCPTHPRSGRASTPDPIACLISPAAPPFSGRGTGRKDRPDFPSHKPRPLSLIVHPTPTSSPPRHSRA
ncbi:MAG: hypothetical protein AAGD22_13690 [Verrucomicrobiota bacterium]